MTVEVLAPAANKRKVLYMSAPPTEQGRGLFAREATQVLASLKTVLQEIIATLGVKRPVELQKLLKLDSTLSWQLFKLASDEPPLAAGSAVPSRASLEKFNAAALGEGVTEEQVDRLIANYRHFEVLVDRHAGDRTTYNSLVTAAAGMSDEWLATDLQHRRNMYRGQSHALGVQAQTSLTTSIIDIRRAPDGSVRYRVAHITGYVNLRALREIEMVRVHATWTSDRHVPLGMEVSRKPVNLPGEGSLLEQFCHRPTSQLQIQSASGSDWVETNLVRPEVGNTGMATVMFGDEMEASHSPDSFMSTRPLPVERSIVDLILPAELLSGDPTTHSYLRPRSAAGQPEIALPLMNDFEVRHLGRGPASVVTPEFPAHADMIRAVAAACDMNVSRHQVWRSIVDFPMYQSTFEVRLPLSKEHQSAGESAADPLMDGKKRS